MEKREIDLAVSCYGKVKEVKYDVVISSVSYRLYFAP